LFACVCFVGQVAIPVVPTVRVVITFTKFVDLQPTEQFYTPFSSPRHLIHGGRGGEEEHKSETHHSSLPSSSSSSSSLSSMWLRRSNSQSVSASKQQQQHQRCSGPGEQESDPFAIPSGYTWTSVDDKSRKMKKSKSTRKSK
jgi:hypothetical protein